MRCPTCKKDNTLRPWEGLTTVMGIEIEGRGQRCRACGEILIELTERGRQERLAAERLIARGIRSGVEFKFVRKLAGLRANEVAACSASGRRPSRDGSGVRSRSRGPLPTRLASCSHTRS